MRGHLTVLSVLYLLVGGVSLVVGALLLAGGIGGGLAIAAQGEAGAGLAVGSFGTVLGVALAVTGLPELIAGVGLWRRWRWGRWLGVILSVLYLPAFPVGTLLGAYGLWILLSEEGAAAFQTRVGIADFAVVAGTALLAPRDECRGRHHHLRRGRTTGLFGGLAALLILGLAIALLSSKGTEEVATAPKPAGEPVQVAAPVAPVVPRQDPSGEPPPPESPKAVYQFTDDDGALHFVDRLELVPLERRATARRIE